MEGEFTPLASVRHIQSKEYLEALIPKQRSKREEAFVQYAPLPPPK